MEIKTCSTWWGRIYIAGPIEVAMQAARLTVDRYGADNDVRIVYNPVVEEDRDNLRFAEDVGTWLGRDVEVAFNPKWPTCSAVDVMYLRGYPNANCLGCVKASSPTYWNHVRQADPEVFAARAKQSREIGAKLVRVRGKRIFLDELKPEDRGRSMAGMDFECGIFCEEQAA